MKRKAQYPRFWIQMASSQRLYMELRRRYHITQLQVCQILRMITPLRMYYADLLLSYSIPLTSCNDYSGYYIRPNPLMNVRHPKFPLLSESYSLMAFNLPENSLILRESEAFELEDELAPELNRALTLTLAGKLLATNRPSLSNLTYFASKTWECPNRLKVYDYGGGLYSFEFVLDSDVLRVVKGGPWYLDGKLMLIQRVNPNLPINRLVFESVKLWVRCFDLPPKAYNIKFAKALGNMLGCFVESDLPDTISENTFNAGPKLPTVRKYLRIKVTIDLAVPLKRSQYFKIRNSLENKVEEYTVRLAYERLSLFCYRCGLLGHEVDNCEKEGPIIYSDWIRAEKFYRAPAGSNNSNTTQEDPIPAQNREIIPDAPNPLTLDPSIILANFRQFREEGLLPPVPPSLEAPQFGSLNQALFACDGGSSSSQPPSVSAATGSYSIVVSAPTLSVDDAVPLENSKSILGVGPVNRSLMSLPPIHPNTLPVSSNFVPSYFNPLIPSSDLFSPTTHRCLFKSDLVHPALSNKTKTVVVSPPDLSPINSSPSEFNYTAAGSDSPVTNAPVGGETKGKSARGKRPISSSSAKNNDTPKPKRGRPAGTSKNA